MRERVAALASLCSLFYYYLPIMRQRKRERGIHGGRPFAVCAADISCLRERDHDAVCVRAFVMSILHVWAEKLRQQWWWGEEEEVMVVARCVYAWLGGRERGALGTLEVCVAVRKREAAGERGSVYVCMRRPVARPFIRVAAPSRARVCGRGQVERGC